MTCVCQIKIHHDFTQFNSILICLSALNVMAHNFFVFVLFLRFMHETCDWFRQRNLHTNLLICAILNKGHWYLNCYQIMFVCFSQLFSFEFLFRFQHYSICISNMVRIGSFYLCLQCTIQNYIFPERKTERKKCLALNSYIEVVICFFLNVMISYKRKCFDSIVLK